MYLNWRNLPGLTPSGSKPIENFAGVASDKMLMGILTSRNAGTPDYYYTPEVIEQFKDWMRERDYHLAGWANWNSYWDKLNEREVSNACLKE